MVRPCVARAHLSRIDSSTAYAPEKRVSAFRRGETTWGTRFLTLGQTCPASVLLRLFPRLQVMSRHLSGRHGTGTGQQNQKVGFGDLGGGCGLPAVARCERRCPPSRVALRRTPACFGVSA